MYAGKGDYNLKKAEERIWELRIGKGKRLVIEKVLEIEFIVTGVISLLLFLAGWIGGGSLTGGVEMIKNGFFFLASLLLFLLAGMFLVKEKGRGNGAKWGIGVTAVLFLGVGVLADYSLLVL